MPMQDAGGSAGSSAFPGNTGINATTLTVTGIEPASGPFAGGNQATVRGSAFTKDALVFIGDRLVQPADTILVDRNSLLVVVPAGEVGPADVRVEVPGEDGKTETATRADAYTYNPLLLEPTRGSIAGGTSVLVTLQGAHFDKSVEVDFGGEKCSGLKVITPSQVRCKTPPGEAGKADVVVRWPDHPSRALLTAAEAFEYVDVTDTDRGGLSGEPIDGTINVSVIDSMAGLAVPKAFVLLGDDPKGKYHGLTDARGQITFSGSDLHGPITVHVVVKCMERASIVAFDAQNVTVHVTPLFDPSCGMPGEPPPAGRGTRGSLISGELIFPGSDEFAVNAWDAVPPPRANEVRVAYVFTTQTSVVAANPTPSVDGTMSRVVEETSTVGVHGYPYSIFARPAGLAVYAISGLERRDTGEFTPYLMGVHRGVLTAPGEETTGVDITMNIALDRELQVSLAHLPKSTPRGPTQFHVQAHIDLGAEGVIVRQVNGQNLDLVTSFTSGTLFRLFAQPGLTGSLGDARYQVTAGWYSSDHEDQPPYTEVHRLGIVQADDAVAIEDFLDIPRAKAPDEGAFVPNNRELVWTSATTPDMFVVEIVGGDGLPAWTQIVPGTLTRSTIPDFSKVKGLKDIAAGVIVWSVRAIRIEDFVYNAFKYNQLSQRFWSHTSVDTFTMQR